MLISDAPVAVTATHEVLQRLPVLEDVRFVLADERAREAFAAAVGSRFAVGL